MAALQLAAKYDMQLVYQWACDTLAVQPLSRHDHRSSWNPIVKLACTLNCCVRTWLEDTSLMSALCCMPYAMWMNIDGAAAAGNTWTYQKLSNLYLRIVRQRHDIALSQPYPV